MPTRAPLPATLDVVADRDDDDLNGVPDAEESVLAPLARVDALPLGRAFQGATLTLVSGGDHARVLVGGRPFPWKKPLPADALMQGISPGVMRVQATRGGEASTLTIAVTGLGLRDGAGSDVDFTRSHASLDRSPPAAVSGDGASRYDEPDPLRLTVVTPNESPPSIRLESVGPDGTHKDGLAPVLAELPCLPKLTLSPEPALHCYASDPIRFVIDEVDSHHALAAARSVRAELGGAIVLRNFGRKEQAIRVLGPRDSPSRPIGRLRTTLRPFVVRLVPGGVPAIGGNDAGAVATLRAELAQAALAWAECGVTFGPVADIPVHVVDPPPSYLLAIGDLLGMPASGGHIHVTVDGKKEVVVATRAGELPIEVARAAAEAFTTAGYSAVVSPNARVGPGAEPSVDVLVRSAHSGRGARDVPVPLEPVHGVPLSDDASLVVRIGHVDLADGLDHFTDMDAVAGTLEETTLLKALDDGDPSTIEVVVVPFFSGGGRIGESFIGTDHSSLRNVVVFDRAGVRARRTSLTLAHELGHVLLDIPGHPDDYGVDTPTRLMDADASDASPFGPRRLTLAECGRVVRESGPAARMPLLRDWPLTPLVYPSEPP